MKVAFVFLSGLLLIFILWPLGQTIFSTSPNLLWSTIKEREVQRALWLTFYASALATGIGLFVGIPLAYLLARHDFPGRHLIEGIINLPAVIPHAAAGIALLMVFRKEAFWGRAFGALGLRFVSSVPGIVIAMLFVGVPILVSAARDGFLGVDTRLERVARTLGASPWATFLKVTLPLTWRGIVSGAVLMWARGLSEFGAVMIIAYHPMVAPVLLYRRFEAYGLGYAQPVATWLILLVATLTLTDGLQAHDKEPRGGSRRFSAFRDQSRF